MEVLLGWLSTNYDRWCSTIIKRSLCEEIQLAMAANYIYHCTDKAIILMVEHLQASYQAGCEFYRTAAKHALEVDPSDNLGSVEAEVVKICYHWYYLDETMGPMPPILPS
ncbi:hypothetical protein PCASD_06008 [Puccinia coronata f. sp. avenae]|uniref:Uncharacterized protein n=1 Tax=Puccinia coronata f. sp. avenae TaxID=200324 RepID=A0A2N5V9Y1_9BASI|nr:hypothetical protein PCASD_06008 [Puccinia coronata f. sp. avenae]